MFGTNPFLVDVSKENVELSVVIFVDWVVPVLSLNQTNVQKVHE